MSIWVSGRVKIKALDRAILEAALSEIAKKIGATLVKGGTVRGWNKSMNVDYLLETKLVYGNGYGIIVEDGTINVYADEHGAKYTVAEVANMIAQEYTAIALQVAFADIASDITRVENQQNQAIELYIRI